MPSINLDIFWVWDTDVDAGAGAGAGADSGAGAGADDGQIETVCGRFRWKI